MREQIRFNTTVTTGYGLLIDPSTADAVVARVVLNAGGYLVDHGGVLVVVDGDIHAAILRVEQAGAEVLAVRELPTDEPDGPRRRHAETFTALVRARAAMRKTPDLRLLWSRYAP